MSYHIELKYRRVRLFDGGIIADDQLKVLSVAEGSEGGPVTYDQRKCFSSLAGRSLSV